MVGRMLEVLGDWLKGLLGRLEARATGRPYRPKNYATLGGRGRGEPYEWEDGKLDETEEARG